MLQCSGETKIIYLPLSSWSTFFYVIMKANFYKVFVETKMVACIFLKLKRF